MTSYQNVAESEISGYNDCPIVDFVKQPQKPRRRVHAQSSSTSISSMSSTSSTALPLSLPQPMPQGPRPGALRKPSCTITTGAGASACAAAAGGTTTTTATSDDTISDDEISDKLSSLFAMENALPERESQHYKNKLQDAVTKGLKPQWKQLIVDSIANHKDKDAVKNNLIKFMLQNDGTTSWATPLRKLLENVA